MKLSKITRDQFVANLEGEESFAKTFVSKADMSKLWDNCFAIMDGDKIKGAYAISVTKTTPKIANFQLLYTFVNYKKQGVARALLDASVIKAQEMGAEYMRISSEIKAIKFYEKCGVKFIGRQKSGTLLTIVKLTSDIIGECEIDISDERLNRYLYGKSKGVPVEIFEAYKKKDQEEW